MRRPKITSFLSIKTEKNLNILASIALKETDIKNSTEIITPLQNAGLLKSSGEFRILIYAVDNHKEILFKKEYLSDVFGNFNIKISLNNSLKNITALQIFETSYLEDVEIILGTYLPKDISHSKKIVITDFDKTLVETKSSNLQEIYTSLVKPIYEYPIVESGVELFKSYIEKSFHPFLLSASPHFFEDAIRDWLYKNQIYSAGIFLKDYRHFFRLIKGHLAPKDVKAQGLYKLAQLFDITQITDLPSEIVLIGDNYESDPYIYLIYKKIINKNIDPWAVWNNFKRHKIFKLTKKQDSFFLNKIYKMQDLISKHNKSVNVKIYIREIEKRSSSEKLYKSLDLNPSEITFF